MGLELMNSFLIYLKSIRDMDRVLGKLPVPPSRRIESIHVIISGSLSTVF